MASRFFDNYDSPDKAIIHTGFNHSFLNYRQNNEYRMGNFLSDTFDDDIFQVCLHHEMSKGANPSNDEKSYLPLYIDKLFIKNGSKPFGIDIINSPLSELRDENTYFFQDNELVIFEYIAQGYIVLVDFGSMQHSDWIDNFINETNFEKAKVIATTREWFVINENITIEEINILYKKFMTSF